MTIYFQRSVPFQHIKHVNPEILLAVPVPSPLLGNQLFNQVINVYQFRFSLSLPLSLRNIIRIRKSVKNCLDVVFVYYTL